MIGSVTVRRFDSPAAHGKETAVRAGLVTLWSSDQAEGQIDRLKLLKRQTYGRAGFERLRRRAPLAV